MDPKILYLACVLGAAAIYLLLRPGTRALKAAGTIIGLGVFAWMLVEAGQFVVGGRGAAAQERPEFFFAVFSLIAIASAVRMITHNRPVYSALYFIMVVLSSAALFLMLQAEFMAFALVIVYAGAILITYMFVLMLAQQAPNADDPDAQPEYDVMPREPAAAAVVGFIMLAVFTSMIFTGASQLPNAPDAVQANARLLQKLDQMPTELQRAIQQVLPGSKPAPGAKVQVEEGVAYIEVMRPGETQSVIIELPESAIPNNVQLVGLDLVSKFPASLEMAGVILLMAMFGAVVLARKQIELGEDEIREAAGMRRLALHSDEPHDHGSASAHRSGA